MLYCKKEEFASQGKQALACKSRPLFRRVLMHMKAKKKTQKLSPSAEMVEELPDVSVHLNSEI